MTILCRYTPTALGPFLVARSPEGVCFLQFGESVESLLNQLRDHLPAGAIVALSREEDSVIDRTVATIHAAIEGQKSEATILPIAPIGTDFQRKVWECLRLIPSGEVRTYSAVAQALAMPRATRAVANACGANSIAILVPCHRIIRSDGSLGGYRWGLERKRKLLAREGAELTYQGNKVTGDIAETT
jgi:AraC family transcriptional regulator of adaptative response/methylated-DNA-[protein]-cysteine methyltransferase